MTMVHRLLPLVLLASCASPQASAPDAGTSTNPAISGSSTTSVGVPTTSPEFSQWDGLLMVDSESGDLLRYTDGAWFPVFDGPAYSDESASSFIESATAVDDRVVVGWCCEPTIGTLRFADVAEVIPVAHATHPTKTGSNLVGFIDSFTEDGALTTSLLVAPVSALDSAREIPMPEIGRHSRRMVTVDASTVAFTWSPSSDGEWFLGFVDLGAAEVSLSPKSIPLPEQLEVASSFDGSVILFGGIAPSWFKITQSGEKLEGGSLPKDTFDLTYRNGEILALTDTGLCLGPVFDDKLTAPGTPSWVGW